MLNKFKINTLFGKLLVRFLIVSLIIIVVLGFSTIYFFKSIYYENKETEIINNSKVMIEFLSQSLQRGNHDDAVRWLKVIAELNSGQAWVVDQEGYLSLSYPAVVANNNKRIDFLNFNKILEGNIISQRIESPHFERPMLLIGFPISDSGEEDSALLIFTSVAGINSTINLVQRMMLYSSVLAILLAMIISYMWAKSLSAPLSRMDEIALELSQGNYGKTVDVESEDEVGTLAESINHLSTELEATVEDLVQERNKLKYVLTGMEEGLLAIDQSQQIILINDAVKELFDIEEDNLIEHQFTTVIKKEKVKEIFIKSVKNEESYQEEFNLQQGKIKKRFLIHCTPIYTDDNKLWGIVGLFQDISERWRFEELQKDFVANASHELKAPLTSIKGAAEIMLDGVVDNIDDYRNYLSIILDETNRLTELVEEILKLAEFEADNIELNLTTIEVSKILVSVEEVFTKGLFEQEVDFQVKQLQKEITVKVDKKKIKQVLLNLLDNAYKFSGEDSSIELGAAEEGDEVRFWVKDNGIGIPAEELKNIWERFYKVDKAHTPSQEGSGLGLSIVKWIVEQHGGEVFVDSSTNEGSIFGFYLTKEN